MAEAAVYRDSSGEPWVEVAPGAVVSLHEIVRTRLLEKFGAAPLDYATEEYGLVILVPEE
ncbi:MAG TPA: hypothetical protein VGG75_37935 [Trebonia sp.]|jgi:hypothetical protein